MRSSVINSSDISTVIERSFSFSGQIFLCYLGVVSSGIISRATHCFEQVELTTSPGNQ